MKSWRGLAVIVLAAVGLLANIQGPMAGQATFQSPVKPFVSPLLPSRVISERTRWLFAHDVTSWSTSQQTVPLTFMSPLQVPSPSRTSDFMIGRVAVGIILPESNDVISPSLENWNSAEVDFIRQEVNQALQWWTQQAQSRGISLEFVVPSNHPQVYGKPESILPNIDVTSGKWVYTGLPFLS